MSSQNLVKMANDIGRFFAAEPRRADAVAGIAGHIQRFWEPRMLRKIGAIVSAGGVGLDELPREAVLSLKIPEAPAAPGAAPSSPPAAPSGAQSGGAGH